MRRQPRASPYPVGSSSARFGHRTGATQRSRLRNRAEDDRSRDEASPHGPHRGNRQPAVQRELAPRSASRDQNPGQVTRSEEHTSELQSLMRISYAVFCLKKQNRKQNT